MTSDGGWAAPVVALTDLAPYLGRFVRIHVDRDGVEYVARGFLTEVESGTFVVDDMEYIAQKHVLRVYNINGELIAGQEI